MSARLTWANPPGLPRSVWTLTDGLYVRCCAVCRGYVGLWAYGDSGVVCWLCHFNRRGSGK